MTFVKDNVYDSEQAAKILKRSERTIHKLINSGRLAGRKDGKGYFTTGAAIKAYAEGRIVLK